MTSDNSSTFLNWYACAATVGSRWYLLDDSSCILCVILSSKEAASDAMVVEGGAGRIVTSFPFSASIFLCLGSCWGAIISNGNLEL